MFPGINLSTQTVQLAIVRMEPSSELFLNVTVLKLRSCCMSAMHSLSPKPCFACHLLSTLQETVF